MTTETPMGEGEATPGRPVARQSSLVIVNSVVGALQGSLALFIVARYMGTDVYGTRVFALSAVSLIGLVARLGLPTTHVRRLARGDDVAASNGTYMLLKSALTAIFMLLAGAALFVWFDVLQKPAVDATPTALWLAYWIIVVQALRDIPTNTFQGLRRIAEREAVLFTNTLVTMALTLWAAIAYAQSYGRWSPLPDLGAWAAASLGIHAPVGIDQGVTMLMVASLIGEVVALIVASVLFLRLRIPVGRPTRTLVGAYLLLTLPLMFLTVGEVVTKRLSQALLGFFWDPTELTRYAIPAQLCEVMLLLGTGIAIVLLPAMSAMHLRRDRQGALRLVRDAERWTSLLLWPTVAVAALFSAQVLHIFNDNVADAGVPFTLLALQGLLTSLLLPVQTMAVASGSPRLAARIVVVSVIADLVLALVLVPRSLGPFPALGLGATGAAIATLAATLLAAVLYALPQRDWPGHSSLQPRFLKHLAAAALAGGVVYVLPLPDPTRFYLLAAEALLLVALYAVALVAMRELRRGDWATMRALLRTPP